MPWLTSGCFSRQSKHDSDEALHITAVCQVDLGTRLLLALFVHQLPPPPQCAYQFGQMLHNERHQLIPAVDGGF